MFNIFQKNNKDDRIKIIITLDYKDNIDIKYNYHKSDIDNSHKMAMLLYSINNSLLLQHFIQSLIKENDINFSSSVIDKWKSFETITEPKINEPIVKPLNAFFKNVK